MYSLCGEDGCQNSCPTSDATSMSSVQLLKDGCIPMCTTPSCICKEGFVRDSNNMCILESMCRKYFFLSYHTFSLHLAEHTFIHIFTQLQLVLTIWYTRNAVITHANQHVPIQLQALTVVRMIAFLDAFVPMVSY